MLTSNKKHPFLLFKILISVLLLWFLFKWVNWSDLWNTFLGVDQVYVVLSYALLIVTEGFIAIRLKELMQPTDLHLSLLRLIKIGFIAKFYAIFLPAGIGIGIARWCKVTENKVGRMQFLVVTIVEKSLFILITLISVGLPLILFPDPRVEHLRKPFTLVSMALLLLLFLLYWFCLARPLHGQSRKIIDGIPSKIGQYWHSFARYSNDFKIYRGRESVLLYAAFITFVIQGLIILRIIFLFRAVGVDLPWVTVMWIGSLVFLIQSLPFSFAGVGVREAAFVYAFNLYGLKNEAGLLVGLLFFAQIVANACIGGLLEISDRGNRGNTKGSVSKLEL